ncbi:MAG: AI-2E family transporter [Gammaproteobacteria bacterium]|nr:MAG: AI-2E family transporter [Gammaproteobacteria bacterium]
MAVRVSAQFEIPLFGAVERRLFKATAVMFAIVALAGLIVCVFSILGRTLSFFYNLIMPLSVAGILALVLSPLVDLLERRGRLPRVAATSIVVLFFMATLVGLIFMVVPTLVRQVGQFADTVPDVLARWQDNLSFSFPGLTQVIKASAQDGQLKEMVPAMGQTGSTVRSYAGAMVGLTFVPLMLFFALLSGARLRGNTMSVLSVFNTRTQQKIMYFIDVFVAQLTGFFQGQLVISVIMGAMFATGFTLIGLKGGVLIGLSLGLLNIVPFLGTLIGLMIVLPLSYFQTSGGLQLLGLSMLVFTVVQLVESWLLTPKIMANRSGLHPALVVISVFFWGSALGGITGMILAVPLTAFLVAVWRQTKASLTRSMRSDDDANRIAFLSGGAKPSTAREPPEDPQ